VTSLISYRIAFLKSWVITLISSLHAGTMKEIASNVE